MESSLQVNINQTDDKNVSSIVIMRMTHYNNWVVLNYIIII